MCPMSIRYTLSHLLNENVSCEIEDFVKLHICKVHGILRLRVLRVICDLAKDVSPS